MPKRLSEKKNILVSIKNIHKSFKTETRFTKVLKNVSLEIYAGEFLVIFGPSGCGKSTILHTIMGLEMPDRGEVMFEGMNMWKMNSDDRADTRKREMGIMYQQQNWIKSLTVRENIAFSSQLLGFTREEALEKADTVLELVKMGYRKEYIPTELSSGEQQKIGLARSLITNPKIIIADEPTGNLDIQNGLETVELLENLTKQGITIIMVTHNPEYLEYADRVAFMADGEIYREINTGKIDTRDIQKQIKEDMSKFIKGTKDTAQESVITTSYPQLEEIAAVRRNIPQNIGFFFKFLFMFFSHILAFLYLKSVGILNPQRLKALRIKISGLFKSKRHNISPSINSLDLTEVSFRNLMVKKSRTYITVLGMSLGIGFIVFLLSIGYGMEKLVLNEITALKNQNQIDVSPIVGSNVVLDDQSVTSIASIEGVSEVSPIINAATRIFYNQATTDVVAYGVENTYLEQSSNKLIAGEYLSGDSDILINEEYLSTLGVQSEDIIGETVDLTVVTNSNTTEPPEKQSYTVVGVLRDDNPPVVYLAIDRMKEYIPQEYSSLTVILSDSVSSSMVRKHIEVLGYETNSVMDTITQVESLFKYVKLGLALLGIISFVIAILGMVNTLTVSLLERTKEVGLMKTIGMKSMEIESLFINESMIMGLAGGIVGIFLGILGGFAASLIVSLISISKGGEFILLNSLPWYIVLLIIVISTMVGFFTGLYPSRRAVKIPALDALRYE